MGSAVAMYGLSCLMDVGSEFPVQGSKLCPLALHGWILKGGSPGKSRVCIFNRVMYMAFSGLKTLYKDLNEKKEYTEQVFRSRIFQDMGERMNYSISDFGTNEYLSGIHT